MSSALRLAVPLYYGINLRLHNAGRLVSSVGKQHSSTFGRTSYSVDGEMSRITNFKTFLGAILHDKGAM